ncbi:hemerythrin domain-containing protein [Ekhidna sp.]|uniref:hemerythrin domain-containing protein n=1 Tax=Ekhidna sp. TaxID=2608089 RepID=UPI003513F999
MKQQVDLFTPIHKAIRAMLYQLGSELQCANMTNKEECRLMVDKLEHSLELLEEHARHEDEIIFPAIEKALPGITEESTEEHETYAKKVEQLRSLLAGLKIAIRKDEIPVGTVANLRFKFANFIAYYLLHMNHEEETLLQASIQHLSAEELLNVRLRVQLDTDPERYTEWLQWMLPAMDLSELVPLYRQVRLNATPEVVQKFDTIGNEYIPEHRWNSLHEMMN